MTKIRLETPTVLANGILQTDNPIDGTLQTVKDQNGNSSELQIANNDTKVTGTLSVADTLTAEERINLEADSTATTQTTAVIQATDTNSGIAIVPNGTGAFTLDVPDGTATGGNARGSYAVDLQRFKNNASQVASGYCSVLVGGLRNTSQGIGSSLLGGRDNTSSGDLSFIGGGDENNVSSNYGVISGGQSNTASTNTHATVIGGYQNTSSGQYSVSGGYSNVASGQGAVALGFDNTASGTYNIAMGRASNSTGTQKAVCIGFSNTSSGAGSSTFGGELNQATASYSVSVGGSRNISSGDHSFTSGSRAKSYLSYQKSHGVGGIGGTTVGLQQFSELARSTEDTLTTGATTTVASDLIPDGSNRVWNVTIKYTAVVTNITGTATGVNVGDCKNEVLTIGFKKIGGVSQNVGAINILSTNEDASMNSAVFGISAGLSQEMQLDFSAPTFAGGGSLDIRVVAKVELTEVAW